jgi:hypothetical protein
MYLPVLAMGELHVRPKRAKGCSLEEIIEEFPELTDGTERPIHRPQDAQQQQESYSGKKKRHTSKHVTITHPKTQRILAVTVEAAGSVHDKKIGEPKDELTEEQKLSNATLAKARISIEHSNAGFKRNRSVTDVLRNTRQGMSDALAMVAMGLHNLRVEMRTSYQYQF